MGSYSSSCILVCWLEQQYKRCRPIHITFLRIHLCIRYATVWLKPVRCKKRMCEQRHRFSFLLYPYTSYKTLAIYVGKETHLVMWTPGVSRYLTQGKSLLETVLSVLTFDVFHNFFWCNVDLMILTIQVHWCLA